MASKNVLNLRAYAFDRFKRERTNKVNPDLSALRIPTIPGLISIVLPLYNGSESLHQTLESILSQTYHNLELIALNVDASDRTVALLEDYASKDVRVHIVEHRQLQKPVSFLDGFQKAVGEYLTWIASGNVMQPTCLQQMVDYLRRYPGCDMVYTDTDLTGNSAVQSPNAQWSRMNQKSESSILNNVPPDPADHNDLLSNTIGSAFLYRARVAWLLGNYSACWPKIAEFDYLMQVNELMTVHHIDTYSSSVKSRIEVVLPNAYGDKLGATSQRNEVDKLLIFDDFRRDFCLSPLVWVVDTTGSSSGLADMASRLRERIIKIGHTVYEAGTCDFSNWPQLWLPCVYILLSDSSNAVLHPVDSTPKNATRILAVVRDASEIESPDSRVSTDWDMCFVLGATTSLSRLPGDCQGWLGAPNLDTLLTAVDIRVRSHHVALMENQLNNPAPRLHKLSVVICTYKRSDRLIEAIKSVAKQSLSQADYEVLVVDNFPEDSGLAMQLGEVRQSHFSGIAERLRLIVCPLKGLSHARNAGISEAKGEILCFLDDDALATDTWLERIREAFDRHPNAGIIGGTIRLRVPEPRPLALLPGSEAFWSEFVIDRDTYTPTQYWWEYPWGANWCARHKVLLQIGGFRTRYGRRGRNFGGGEEVVAAALASKLSYEIGIAPDAVVIHNVEPTRFTWNNLRRTIVAGTLTTYLLQRDQYIPMATSIRITLRRIWKTPLNPNITGSRVALLRYQGYQKLGHLLVLSQQLQDWRWRKCRPITMNAN